MSRTLRAGSRNAHEVETVDRTPSSPIYRAPRYRLRVGETEAELDLWQFVFQRKIARTAVYTSLVVGTLLTIINQGDIYVAHHVTGLVLLKTVLTYIVPYCVATFGALSVARVRPKDRVGKDGV